MLSVAMNIVILSVTYAYVSFMLSVTKEALYAECRYECRYSECHLCLVSFMLSVTK